MQHLVKLILLSFLLLTFTSCNNNSNNTTTPNQFRASVDNNNTLVIPINGQIHITFSKPIRQSTINATNIYIVDVDKNPIEIELIKDDLTLIIKPKTVYKELSSYSLVLTKDVASKDGTKLLNVFHYDFKTDKVQDTTAPTLVAVLPDSTKINEFTTFALQFDENLILNNPPYLKVVDETGEEVVGELKENGSTLRFIPVAPFSLNKTYKAELLQDVYDTSYNKYEGEQSWAFQANSSIAFNRGHESYEKSYDIAERINSVKLIDANFYVMTESKLYNIEVEEFLAPFSIEFDSNVYDVLELGNFLFVAGDKGILSYDISTQTILHTYKTNFPIYAIDEHEGKMYVAATKGGIKVLDINKTDASLTPSYSIDMNATAFDILCTNNAFYVASFDKGVARYNYTSTESTGRIDTKSTARKLYLNNNRLYIVDGIGGASIFDIATNNIYQIPSLSYAMDLATISKVENDVNSTYLYMAEKERGVSIYNVTDLENILHVSQVSSNPTLQRAITDDYNINALITTDSKLITFSKAGRLNGFSLLPDLNQPTIKQTVPLNSETQVDLNATITITFTKVVNEDTISNVKVKYDDDTLINSTQIYNSVTKTLTITPTEAFKEGSWVYVTLDGGIKDILGNEVDFTVYEFSFRTFSPDIVSPTVLEYTPNNADVTFSPFNKAIEIKMSEVINPNNLNEFIELYQGDNLIPISIDYNSTTNIISLQSENTLLQDLNGYTIKLYEGLNDLANNSILPTELSFFITSPDQTKPFVLSYSPNESSSIFAPYSEVITIQMSESLDTNSIVGNVNLYRSLSTSPISTSITYNQENNSINITPTSSLFSDSYTIKLSNGIQDLAGNAILDKDLLFTVSDPNVAPTIVSHSPTNGAINVDITNNSALFNFSEAMNQSSAVLGTTVIITNGVSYNVTWNSSTQLKVALNPATTGDNITIALTTGIKDSSGKSMESSFTISFVTN